MFYLLDPDGLVLMYFVTNLPMEHNEHFKELQRLSRVHFSKVNMDRMIWEMNSKMKQMSQKTESVFSL